MNNRVLVFFLGTITGIAVASAWPTLRRGIVLASTPTSGVQIQAPPKVKEDPAFQAEWEKLRNSDPAKFEKHKAQFIVMAQMELADFGYGTSFTADLDAETKEALKAYQTYRGLSPTADIDPLTIDQLSADDELIHQQELYLAPFQFLADGWDLGGFTSNGSWVEDGATDSDIQNSQVECYRDWKLCIDGQAHELKAFGGGENIVGKFEAYQIKSWDKYEIVADSAYSNPCERDTLRINRQEKSVTLISTPAYQNEKTCKDFLGKPQTVNYHLADGSKISTPRNQKRKDALRYLLKFSDKARAIMFNPS